MKNNYIKPFGIFNEALAESALNKSSWYYGIADCTGLESFVKEPDMADANELDDMFDLGLSDADSKNDPVKKQYIGNLSMMQIRCKATNSQRRIKYMVQPVGDSFRIFAKTRTMIMNGSEYEDCESLFGKGTMWKDYDTDNSAQSAIDMLSHEYSVVYRAKLAKEDAAMIHGLLKAGDYINALEVVKGNSQEVQLVRGANGSAEKAWKMIPNPDLDPMHY